MTDSAALPQWDLERLYASPEAWETDFQKIRPLAEIFASYRGRLGESAEILAAAIAALDDFERLGEKVYVYAHLRSDENTADSANRARVDRVVGLFAELSEISAWFEPEIMAIAPAKMDQFLADPALKLYRRSVEELLRERPHTLSEPEERLLGTFGEVLGAPSKTFSLINDADLRFGKIRNAKGKLEELTHENYGKFMEDPDRKIRRNAFRHLYDVYTGMRNTLASTLDATVKKHVISARVRHYPSALGASLFSDKISEDVYRNLIASVHDRIGYLHDYMDFRRSALHLKQMDMYDVYAPLQSNCRAEYSFEEAAQLVRDALKPLGEEYCRILDTAFTDRWVDAAKRRGKRSGAYSSGCYDSLPYILLNYSGTLNDVFTLAHELGHSMHSYLSNRTQHYHYADYCIFLAEVASTTNETLLFEHMMKQTGDPELRRYLLCHQLNEIRGTIFRQTQFAEFELKMHELAAAGTPLSADLLDEEYYKLNAFYYGPALAKADRRIAVEWARIPHFYYNFYVYKYATGMSAALRLAKGILEGGNAERTAYLNFLSAGDSYDPLDILRDAGVDLARPEPVCEALDYFGNTVRRLRDEWHA